MDNLSKSERSRVMARIRSKDTRPELLVRSLAHRLGYRFRLHRADLPGKPDMVFPRLGKIIFVHGCFWHHHEGCGRIPKTNRTFWRRKLFRNRERDLGNQQALKKLGWKILILWECQLHKKNLTGKLQKFLDG